MDNALPVRSASLEHKYDWYSWDAGKVGNKPGRNFDSPEPVRVVHQRRLKCPKALVVGVVIDMERAGEDAHVYTFLSKWGASTKLSILSQFLSKFPPQRLRG